MNKIKELEHKAEKYKELIKIMEDKKAREISKMINLDVTHIYKIRSWIFNISLKKIEKYILKLKQYEKIR